MWTTAMIATMVVAATVPAVTDAQRERKKRRPAGLRVQPTHADVPYGEHPQQKIDLYLAKSDKPTPLVLYIHSHSFPGSGLGTRQLATLQPSGEMTCTMAFQGRRSSGVNPPTALGGHRTPDG
jgi:hypothetical protein